MQTHANAHECMQTQMHARGYGHKSMQVGPHECMQIHADANAHMLTQMDVARQTQRVLCPVCGWTQLQDVSGH